jgi:HlyD family secretion protein
MSTTPQRWIFRGLLLAVAAVSAYVGWRALTPEALPPSIARGNGRIEAVEIDISTKTPGRIREILVNEGDFVTEGQVIARMDIATLEAQLREAEAQLQRAIIATDTARTRVVQREAEREAADAVVAQRTAEFEAARQRLARSEELAPRGAVPLQRLDDDRAAFQASRAATGIARAQLAAAESAIMSARGDVLAAEAAAEAVRATLQRIQADIDDSTLRAPRAGRVQYRVAQPGEVLGAGGRVVNIVDLSDVYMTFFLPTRDAGRLSLGDEARIVIDAAPDFVFPAAISLVADVAQFTPRSVETAEERLRLMFRVRARVSPELLQAHARQVKTGLPGVAYVRVDPNAAWPERLRIRLPPR